MTRARRKGDVSAQAGNAFCAEATATFTSAVLAKCTCAVTAPVAGLKTSCVRVLLPWLDWPETKWAMVAVLINSLSKNFKQERKGLYKGMGQVRIFAGFRKAARLSTAGHV